VTRSKHLLPVTIKIYKTINSHEETRKTSRIVAEDERQEISGRWREYNDDTVTS
jgi:hypothetical protein